MSDAEDVKRHVRVYIWVFAALIVGTILTVGASYVPDEVFAKARIDGHVGHIVLALVIATIKAFLVAGYFMHLLSERKLIYSLLVITALFFVSLMYLTYWSMEPQNIVHIPENVS